MAAPSTPILDNFTRANGAIGSNYTVYHSGGTMGTVASNKYLGSGVSARDAQTWNPTSYPTNQEAYVTGITNPSLGYIYIRTSNTGTASVNGYQLVCDVGFTRLSVYRITADSEALQISTSTTLGGALTGLWLQGIGTTLSSWGLLSGTWTAGPTGTDSTYTSGNISFETVGGGTTAMGLAAFGGGAIGVPPDVGFSVSART